MFWLGAVASYGATVAHSLQRPPDSPVPDRPSRFLSGIEELPLSLDSDEAVMSFLRTARVVSSEEVGKGVTGTRKVLLEKDGVRLRAIFRDVRIHRPGRSPRVTFRDDYIFECAAYELSRLLGLDNVPAVVERAIQGKKGSLQLWIEGALTEKERREKGLSILGEQRLNQQWQVMLVFDNLIFNDDRNRGNYLYDRKGKLWMIDHTRSFQTDDELPYVTGIRYLERQLWERLQKLQSAVVKKHLEEYLSPSQLVSLISSHPETPVFWGLGKFVESSIEAPGVAFGVHSTKGA